MRRWLVRLAVIVLAFTIGFASSNLKRILWQQRPQSAGKDAIESNPSNRRTEDRPRESESGGSDDYLIVEGRYTNFDYAYSVLVPKGMMAAMNSKPPNPNHGFGIDLMHPTSTAWTIPKVSLWADAGYDSAEYRSPKAVIKNNLEWLRQKHNQVRLLSRSPARLGSLRAVRFIIAYEESGEAMIEDQVVGFRSQLGEESDIIYTIHLTTTGSRYNQDKQLVLEMQRSWIIDPLPNDYPLPPVYEAR